MSEKSKIIIEFLNSDDYKKTPYFVATLEDAEQTEEQNINEINLLLTGENNSFVGSKFVYFLTQDQAVDYFDEEIDRNQGLVNEDFEMSEPRVKIIVC